jgi:hypothetical protein
MIDILIIAYSQNTFDCKPISQMVSAHTVPRIGEYIELASTGSDYEVLEVNHYFGADPQSIEVVVKEIS